jgi:5-(carboxyamino)imidazole ribonucleotide synthase
MINLLGVDDENDFVRNYPAAMSAHPTAKLHVYGKSARKGRKMGHVTAIGEDAQQTLATARAAAEILRRGN